MGFYGNISNVNKTNMTFDKIYSNRKSMDESCALDGVYAGRYVLVEYEQYYPLDTLPIIYKLNSDKEEKFSTTYTQFSPLDIQENVIYRCVILTNWLNSAIPEEELLLQYYSFSIINIIVLLHHIKYLVLQHILFLFVQLVFQVLLTKHYLQYMLFSIFLHLNIFLTFYSPLNLISFTGIFQQLSNLSIISCILPFIAILIQSNCVSKSKDVLKTALKSGADSGAKAALAGALKVASEKGVIRLIPKGTPVGVFANIACIAVENIKIIAKIANGELSMQEGLYKMEEIAVAMIGGFVLMGKGAAIGGTIGLVFGPVGVAIGSFIGGTIGYMMGSKAGEIFVRTSRKIRNYVTNKVVENVNSVKDKIRNFVTSTMFYKDVILN